jgi:catechol 2,3-dioxygenase-like lactoylglutathione lyase family enzyme
VPVHWYSIVVDCHDPATQADWWADVLGWEVVHQGGGSTLTPPRATGAGGGGASAAGPVLDFVPVPEDKSVKNRLHIDVAPPADGDQASEVARLEELGARRVDVGQQPAENDWVVLADPEGNEFCVLTPRD